MLRQWFVVGTTVAAIISLLVVSGDNKVSTKDAFTMFENNTGWANSEQFSTLMPSDLIKPRQTDGRSSLHSLRQCGP